MRNLGLERRPKNLDEIVGNQNTVAILRSKSPEKLQKAILISGLPGCGKTTLARIIFDMLGADKASIVEYNMATDGVKSTARKVEDELNFKPAFGKINGWIFDEAHKATVDTISGLLKPLEDSHDFNYFIFCTSDMPAFFKKFTPTEKDAFLRRCVHLKVSQITDDEGFEMLDTCLNDLDFNSSHISDAVLEEILSISAGIPANMYKNLETIMDLQTEKEMIQYLKDSYEQSEEHEPKIKEFCQALLDGNWSQCAKIIKYYKKNKTGYETIKGPVMGYMQSVLLNDTSLSNNITTNRAYACIETFKTINHEGRLYALTTAARYVCLVGRGKDG
jgi:DNA polymerase III gamma/tau subunit